MTITLHWWMFVIVLVAAPIVYGMFYKSKYDYDFDILGLLVLVLCWALAIGISIGVFVQKLF